MSDDTKLTFTGHLRELRSCLLRTVIALIVALLVCFGVTYYFKDFIFGILTKPALQQVPELPIVFTEVTEMMATYIKVTLYTALALVLPFVIYQIVMFIRPALTRRERGYFYRQYLFCLLLGPFLPTSSCFRQLSTSCLHSAAMLPSP